MSSLVFGKDDTFASIKETLATEKATVTGRVEFDSCPLESNEWRGIVGLLHEDIVSFTADRISISDRSIKSLVKRCKKITALKLVDCKHLSDRCMKSVGVNLSKLNSIHFEYRGGSSWPDNVDVLSILVKNCVSELDYVAFVGFNSVTDVGVCYSVECFNYLQVINLSYCRFISDKGVIGVIDQCAHLKEIRLRGTQITNKSLMQIAHKAKRLICIDFSDCNDITHEGIKALVGSLGKAFQEVSLAGCIQLGDLTLIDILCHCTSLKYLDFSGTSVSQVPPYILALRRLQVALFHNCTQLIKIPATMTQLPSSLKDFVVAYKQYNVPYRLRVFFLGEKGSDKTALIYNLVRRNGSFHKHTSGADVYYWQPLQHSQPETGITIEVKRAEESNLLLEIYDLPEHKAGLAALSVLFSSESLYVIVVNPGQDKRDRSIQRYVTLIQSKAASSRILVVETASKGHSDIREKILTTTQDEERQNVKHIQKEIDFLRHLEYDLKVSNRIEELQALIQLRPSLSSDVTRIMHVPEQDTQEVKESTCIPLSEFMNVLISECLNYKNFHHMGRSLKVETIEVLSAVFRLMEQNILILTWDELVQIMGKQNNIEVSSSTLIDIVRLLHNVGYLVDLHFLDPFTSQEEDHNSHYICINPPLLGHCLKLMHPETSIAKKTAVDIKKLWSKKASRPDPGVLLAALEEVTEKGCIRESIVPIILQNLSLNETQIQLFLDVVTRLGLQHAVQTRDKNYSRPVTAAQETQNAHIVQLPQYPSLSYHTCYRMALSDVEYSVRPNIHWPVSHHSGDIQISWKYEFPCGAPPGLTRCLLSMCHMVAIQGKATAIHAWTRGVFCKFGEASIYIEDDGKQLSVSGRVIADDPGHERVTVLYLWAQLSPMLHIAQQHLMSWNGLFYKICLESFGKALHKGVVIVKEPALPLMQCIDLSKKQQEYSFIDDSVERYLDVPLLLPFDFFHFYDIYGWICHLVENRDTVTALVEDDEDDLTFTDKLVCERVHLKSVISTGKSSKIGNNLMQKSVSFDMGNVQQSPARNNETKSEASQEDNKNLLHTPQLPQPKSFGPTKILLDSGHNSVLRRKDSIDYRSLEGTSHYDKMLLMYEQNKKLSSSVAKSTQTECTGETTVEPISHLVHKQAAAIVAEVMTKSIVRHLKNLEETKKEVPNHTVAKDKISNGSAVSDTGNGKHKPVAIISDVHHSKRNSTEKSNKSRTCTLL